MAMITKEYCVQMARYNAWQNAELLKAMQDLGEEAAHVDRGAFFGSILATANHVLWGDRIWMHRLDGWPAPKGGPESSTTLCPTIAVWGSERFHTDGLLREWASGLHSLDLTGDLEWTSAHSKITSRHSKGLLIMQMFNHQTHHRGQIHAMITAAGGRGYVTDLPRMP